MSMELHGWIALSTSADEWDDGNFANAFEQVAALVADLPAEDGYDGMVSNAGSFPCMVYLKGIDVETMETAEQLVRRIAAVFDKSYGELVVADCASLQTGWNASEADRYCISAGELRPI